MMSSVVSIRVSPLSPDLDRTLEELASTAEARASGWAPPPHRVLNVGVSEDEFRDPERWRRLDPREGLKEALFLAAAAGRLPADVTERNAASEMVEGIGRFRSRWAALVQAPEGVDPEKVLDALAALDTAITWVPFLRGLLGDVGSRAAELVDAFTGPVRDTILTSVKAALRGTLVYPAILPSLAGTEYWQRPTLPVTLSVVGDLCASAVAHDDYELQAVLDDVVQLKDPGAGTEEAGHWAKGLAAELWKGKDLDEDAFDAAIDALDDCRLRTLLVAVQAAYITATFRHADALPDQ